MILTISLISEYRIIPLYIERKTIQIAVITRFVNTPGKKAMISDGLKERWCRRKKENINDEPAIIVSKQNIIQRGAKFLSNRLGISVF